MNILGLSSRYNDIVADGNERLSDEPLKIGTKTDNDLSFIVNNQEQLKLTSSGANITIDEIQGGTDGKIEICGAELEGCGTIEGEWVQIPNPAVSTEVLPDGKPRVNFSSSISDFVILDNFFTNQDEINISFRVEKDAGTADEVAVGYYGNTPPLTFNDPSTAFSQYFGVKANLPFTDQSNTGNGDTTLSPVKLQPVAGSWSFADAGVYRIRFTLLDGKASWFVKPPDLREYRVSTCDISNPIFTGNWVPYVYSNSTGNITSNTHISRITEDVVIDGWDVNETFNHLNELANNEAVEQLPQVLKVVDSGTNDWKLERTNYEYTLPNRSGRLLTIEDIAADNQEINTEVLTLEIAENTTRISQAESDISGIQSDVVANANDITNLQSEDVSLSNRIDSNDTDITALQSEDVSLSNRIDSNEADIGELRDNPAPIVYEKPESNTPIEWDTQDKTATVSIEANGTIFADNPSTTANAYSVNIIDTEIYNYTLRTTLKDVDTGSIHFIGLFGAKVNPIPAFAFVDSGIGSAILQGGIHFMINHGSQPSIQYRTSQSLNTVIDDSSGAGDLEVAEDYLEFTITDSVITQVNKNGSPLVFTGANFTMDEKKYYFGYHDLNTTAGSIRIQAQIISKTLRSSVNTGSLNFLLSNLQTQVDNNDDNITVNATEIQELETAITEIEAGTETTDLTALNEAVFLEEPPSGFQKVEWEPSLATLGMTFIENTVSLVNSSTTPQSICSKTLLDFARYDYDILINCESAVGRTLRFGYVENGLLIDDYITLNTDFLPGNSQFGSELGDGMLARLFSPQGILYTVFNFSRTQGNFFDSIYGELVVGGDFLFSIRSGILLGVSKRDSASSPWIKFDFTVFAGGALADPKLRAVPQKNYRLWLSDDSANLSGFVVSVSYKTIEKDNNKIELKQEQVPDIRRSQFHDNSFGKESGEYIISEKNRLITMDTSMYPIYYDGPTQSNLLVSVELDPAAVESDYDVIIKHYGSNNTLTLQSGSIAIDPLENTINPWSTTTYRVMSKGEEGNTNDATMRKLYSDYNELSVCWSFKSNLDDGKNGDDFWLIPFNQEAKSFAHGAWSGRFYMPRRSVLRSFIVLGDNEAYNTFLTGNFRLSIYKEIANVYASSATGTDGSLVKETFIRGRNATFTATETNTKMYVLNGGFDPDNTYRSTDNVIGIVNMGEAAHIIPAGYTISVRASSFGGFDGNGVEFKGFMYYQYI